MFRVRFSIKKSTAMPSQLSWQSRGLKILVSLVRFRNQALRGCSSMVEHQPSKLDTWVRFPSPAFHLQIIMESIIHNRFFMKICNLLQCRCDKCVRSSAGQSNGLLSRGSGVRIPSSTFPYFNKVSGFIAVWWVQRSWLARQIVALEAQGSNPCIHLCCDQCNRFEI